MNVRKIVWLLFSDDSFLIMNKWITAWLTYLTSKNLMVKDFLYLSKKHIRSISENSVITIALPHSMMSGQVANFSSIDSFWNNLGAHFLE